MRIVVLAYHNIGCRCLEVLIRNKQNVTAVFTHKDNPDENIWFDSVAELAKTHGIPCHVPDNINTTRWIDLLTRLKPDILFSFYFRQMLSKEVLDIPPKGAINLHGSYLPKYRGRCPVNWVLINGEKETGVTLHYMVGRPDAGDIIARERIPVDFSDTAWSLFKKMERAAARLLEETLPDILGGTNARLPQDLSQGSYFGGRGPEDGRIDWKWSSLQIYNLIRAVTHPYPGAYTLIKGKKLFIWKALPVDAIESSATKPPGSIEIRDAGVLVATGQGHIRVVECQIEGKRALRGFDELKTVLHHGDRFDREGEAHEDFDSRREWLHRS